MMTTTDGKDALLKSSETKFDLVVTDINMPEMNGIELIRQIRVMREHKFMPIIVISTLSGDEDVKVGRMAGASGWIFKPHKSKQLIDAVRKFIR